MTKRKLRFNDFGIGSGFLDAGGKQRRQLTSTTMEDKLGMILESRSQSSLCADSLCLEMPAMLFRELFRNSGA